MVPVDAQSAADPFPPAVTVTGTVAGTGRAAPASPMAKAL